MKRILTIFLLFPFLAQSQDVSGDVQKIATAAAAAATQTLAASLDSVVKLTPVTTTAQTFTVDSIVLTPGSYHLIISVSGFNTSTGDYAGAIRELAVTNFNGVNTIRWTSDQHAWAGTGTLVKTSWITNVSGSAIVVKITTITAPINWTYKRYSL